MLFPVIYTDNAGTIATHFKTDGRSIRVILRDTTFTGHSFDELSLVNEREQVSQGITTDHLEFLTNCTLDMSIPIRIRQLQEEKMGRLSFRLHLESGKTAWFDQLSLRINEHTTLNYPARKGEFMMEAILSSAKKDLPENVMLLCCFDCAFAHYNPSGNSAFGGMRCYKKIKSQVFQITNKSDFMDLQNLYHDEINLTQETWYCKAFQFPAPDQWRYI